YVRRLFGLIPFIRDKDTYIRDATYFSEIWRRAGSELPARKIATHGASPIFVYRFDWAQQPTPPIDLRTLNGAGHALEISFVTGEFVSGMAGVGQGFTEANAAGRKAVQNTMNSYWAEFAYTGNPGKGRDGALPEWTSWTNDPSK